LGACLGHCPQGAIQVIEREADAYNEKKVMENVMAQGEEVINQHLEHLRENGEEEALQQALEILNKNKASANKKKMPPIVGGCPGSQAQEFQQRAQTKPAAKSADSALNHWPIQMHLISPHSPHYLDSDLLLAADCVAFSLGNFHQDYLSGKKLIIACPKLDSGQEVYVQKLVQLIDQSQINTIHVLVMEVPCCGGLLRLVQQATQMANRKVPVKSSVISISGEVLKEEWV
jgi:hypothetical protein